MDDLRLFSRVLNGLIQLLHPLLDFFVLLGHLPTLACASAWQPLPLMAHMGRIVVSTTNSSRRSTPVIALDHRTRIALVIRVLVIIHDKNFKDYTRMMGDSEWDEATNDEGHEK
jgi:hypothetical protein